MSHFTRSPSLGSDRLAPQAVLLVLTRSLSALGASMSSFGMDVWVFERTGSYAAFAALALVAWVPQLLLAPVAGMLVDRINKKTVLLTCELTSVAAIVLVALQAARGTLDVASIGAAIFMLSVAGNVRWIAMGATLTLLVPDRALDRINGLQQSLEGVVLVSGPLLGTAALGLLGLDAILGLNLLASGIAVLAMLQLSASELSASVAASRLSLWREATFGVRWIWSRPRLRAVLLFTTAYNLAGALFTVAATPYVLSFASNRVLGISLAAEGVGALAIGAILTRYSLRTAPERRVLPVTGAFGVVLGAWGVVRAPWAITLAAAGAGVLTTLLIASLQTIWQRGVPADIQGKVFAARRMISWALFPVSIISSVPIAHALFEPMLRPASWPRSIWGDGRAGALGMMLSLAGTALAIASAALWARGGFTPLARPIRPPSITPTLDEDELS